MITNGTSYCNKNRMSKRTSSIHTDIRVCCNSHFVVWGLCPNFLRKNLFDIKRFYRHHTEHCNSLTESRWGIESIGFLRYDSFKIFLKTNKISNFQRAKISAKLQLKSVKKTFHKNGSAHFFIWTEQNQCERFTISK